MAVRQGVKQSSRGPKGRGRLGREGQSLIEFIFLLPVLFGLTTILLKVNSAIQMSIVNQKYARAQALFLAQNSPHYPRRDQAEYIASRGSNQVVMGVGDTLALDQEANASLNIRAQSLQIARSKQVAAKNGAEDEDEEKNPTKRGLVRIRNTVSLCAPTLMILTRGGGPQRFTSSTLTQKFDPKAFNYCAYTVNGRVAAELSQ